MIAGWRDADFERRTFGFRIWAAGGEVALGRRLYRVRWRDEGGFRLRWLARLTGGRVGLGRWTQEEVDRIKAQARADADEMQRYVE